MSLRSLTLITLSLCSALLVGCVDTRASEGRCEGTIGGAAVSFAIDGDSAAFEHHAIVPLRHRSPTPFCGRTSSSAASAALNH